jgi:hypothetical protein
MSRQIKYTDDVCGEFQGYISNDRSDEIIQLIKLSIKEYKSKKP